MSVVLESIPDLISQLANILRQIRMSMLIPLRLQAKRIEFHVGVVVVVVEVLEDFCVIELKLSLLK